ncbi:polymerase delta 4 [Perilla frutescens var. hirtella]|uniref:Polymerase delta 4 n=1 Tax=Perilla frutescens var. hirtella TaxID=608512 RepID=A0AAD4JEQ8_PERFH|nr:polymerase delta 4 [Perilla frutescens var. hirtella]
MASAGVKGFFREKKKNKISGAISKPDAAKKKTKHSSDHLHPSPHVSHASLDLQDVHDYDDKEKVLRQFDLNMGYGPCLGMSRLERWERANKLGLNPPAEVGTLLRTEKVNSVCLWDGRV